jgi:hypothetical protein
MILYEIPKRPKNASRHEKTNGPGRTGQRAAALSPDTGFPFEKALSGPELSLSRGYKGFPSKGIIDKI